jgi:hypothetical protein
MPVTPDTRAIRIRSDQSPGIACLGFVFALESPHAIIPPPPPVETHVTLADVQNPAVARGVLESVSEDTLVLLLPGTDYRIELVPAVPAARLSEHVGKRVRGVVNANALRIHPAAGGGRFIEPIYGMPRIVAGDVVSADEPAGRVVVRSAIPMVLATLQGQDFSILTPGTLVNFYVQAGASFRPVD